MTDDSWLDIDGPYIILKKKHDQDTHRLYELLFKKKPKNFNNDDVDNYNQIVMNTNAYSRYCKPNQHTDGNKLRKYKKNIGPNVTVRGILIEVDDNTIDYVHWDDPNELAERLRLLLASASASHINHEIN